MTMILKNIKEYTQELKQKYREDIEKFGKAPKLCVFQVGDNEASVRYIKNKKKDCEEVGIDFEWYWYPEEITTHELKTEITDMLGYCDGLIVQMPLPAHIDVEVIKNAISPCKDVDGFHPLSHFRPATPAGIMDYLKYCGFDPSGKSVCIIGRSDIVGKPLAKMMTDADATVSLCHSKTQHLHDYVSMADLVVTAVGKPAFLNCYPIHVPVVDVGINFNSEGKLVGDCINTDNRDVTPVPGGVGLLTRCALLDNVCHAAGVYK